jgi:natural product biosynthesis luciferase-like monooxygenase protein
MSASIEELLGFTVARRAKSKARKISFSCLFFSDVRKDISDAKKYEFMRDITLFADAEGFTAVYIPERHFYEFGAIYANAAIVASYLIPQTRRIRFRTAGISLPLHHPAEIVEWWAMNDILSGGRVDLGFGSGWNKADFILSPSTYTDRQRVCAERIPVVQKLWRGETVWFAGPGGESIPVTVHPRPIQKELNVWLLVFQNDDAFSYAGRQGYNIFTMLYGINLEGMRQKIALYRQGRQEAGLDPSTGVVSLMLHTFVHGKMETVENVVAEPFKEYIKSSLNSHVKAAVDLKVEGSAEIGEAEKAKILDYAYQRYFKTAAIFGTVDDAKNIVDNAIDIGVDEIACLMDFGVDYATVKDSLPYLKKLVSEYV